MNCYRCTNRHKGCHSECGDYMEYRAAIEAQGKERKQQISVICFQVEQMQKNKKTMRRKKNFRRTKT